MQKIMWCSAGQDYRVINWSTEGNNQTESRLHEEFSEETCLAPLMLGGQSKKIRTQRLMDGFEDEDADFEGVRLICNMI